jgi:hypothetical protein
MAPSKYDFLKPIQESDEFGNYVKKTEQNLKQRINPKTPKTSHPNSYLWAVVFILMLSLIGLGTFSIVQKQKTDQELATLRNQKVAGANENLNVKNIIAADGFSLVMSQATPNQFKLTRQTEPFGFLPDKIAVKTSLLAKIPADGKDQISGIEVSVSEYDNKLDRQAFDQVVIEKLGKDYNLKSDDINIPNNFKISKIQAQASDGVAYYTAVTTANYYVIKIYTQTSKNNDLAEINRFTDSMLENLYLN